MTGNGLWCAVAGVCIWVKLRRRLPWGPPGGSGLFFLKNIFVRINFFVEMCDLELKIRILAPKWPEMTKYGFMGVYAWVILEW